MNYPQKIVHQSFSSDVELSLDDFVDVAHPSFKQQRYPASCIGKTMEDIIHCFLALEDVSLFRFMVAQNNNFVDLEATLEVARYLCSQKVRYIPVVPLEPSSVFSLQYMSPEAIEVMVCWPHIQEQTIQTQLLRYMCANTTTPIWLQGTGLTDSLVQTAMNCGCTAVILTQ